MKKYLTLAIVLALLLTACSSRQESSPLDIEPVDRGSDRSRSDPDDRDRPPATDSTDTTYAADTTMAMEDTSDTIARSGETERPSQLVPEVPDDVEFQDYGENPFTPTDEDSLSTFAIDVDTGSYTLMRGWIEEGHIPPPESVRPEEYVNYFDGGYDAPREDIFAVYADGGPTPYTDQEGDVVLRIGIKGQEVNQERRPPVNVTFVVDTSGSMQDGDRLELVKDAIETFVDGLERSDTINVVAYDDEAHLVVEDVSGDESGWLISHVRELEPGGSTNAEAGLLLGYDTASETFDREAINRVVLFSDGVANIGTTGPEGLLERIERDVDRGISLVTVGVGLGNYNDVLMEQLADGADGVYRYADSLEEVDRIFRADLAGTLVTIARDVKVQVEFNDDAVAWYRLIGFENRDVADTDFRDDRVDGGEIGAGHAVTALYQVELARGVSSEDRLATVHVRWVDPDGRDTSEVAGEVMATAISERWDDTDPHFRLAATVAAFAEELREGRYASAYDMGDVSDEADQLARALEDEDVWEFADMAADLARGDRR